VNAVEVRSLVKSYGRAAVLRGLDLDVPAGQSLVMLGANGAGKTTFLRILGTLTRPDSGRVVVNGYDAAAAEDVRRTTGVFMHSPMFYWDLSLRENLVFFASMFRVPDGSRRAVEVARVMDVAERLDDRVRNLSHGLQKRASLARALLHSPGLLVLDEPESGLDQAAIALLEQVLDRHRETGGTSIVATHSIERAPRLGGRVVILAGGKIVFDTADRRVDADALREAYARYGNLAHLRSS
jgi:ABC-type multidrug transport system ATPase subunit